MNTWPYLQKKLKYSVFLFIIFTVWMIIDFPAFNVRVEAHKSFFFYFFYNGLVLFT